MNQIGLLLVLAIAAHAAETQSLKKDGCAPAPGAVAPALPAHLMEGQGNIHFSITTSNPLAQKFFDQGISQMHSFWASEAERSFLQAAQLDPKAPMPWFGVAMVAAGDYRPRHQLEAYRVRWSTPPALTRAIDGARKAMELSREPGSATDLERQYIQAIWARRDPALQNHDESYIAGLRSILASHPNEVEAASYLALHLMAGFELPNREPRAGSMEAVEILRKLVVQYPDHAGVHHYIIHAFEGSSFARDAWPSCRRYPELVTNIPHALHMPGHIWAQTGQWNEGAASFESAAANELGYIHADDLYPTFHHGHNVAYLILNYDFQGRSDKALESARGLMEFQENPRQKANLTDYFTPYRQGWFGTMRTLVFAEDWDRILDGKTLPVYDKPYEQFWRHWAVGLALANKHAIKPAKDELRDATEIFKHYHEKTKSDPPGTLAVGLKELEGQVAIAQRKTFKGVTLLANAAKQERALRYSEPHAYPRPVLRVLAAREFEAGDAQRAGFAWRDLLEQFPGDPAAVSGLAKLEGKPVESSVPSAGF